MDKDKNKPIWIRIIGFMFIPLLVAPLFFFLVYPLKPHCSVGQGVYGCTHLCEPSGYLEDGRPSGYKVTPCYHEEYPVGFQKLIYENRVVAYPLLLLGFVLLLIRLYKTRKLFKIAFAPIYFFLENRKSKNIISRLVNLFILIIPLTLEWVVGYVIAIGTLLNQINLF